VTGAFEKTVLVVDSDDGKSGWQKRIAGWLGNEFKVFTAKTYDKALQCLSSHMPPFHFVVTEISLDEFDVNNQDGFKLANRIKELGQYTKTIILSYSHFADYNRTIVLSLHEKIISDFYEKEPSGVKGFRLDEFLAGCKKVADEAENARKQNLIDIFVVMPFSKVYEPFYMDIEEVAKPLDKICKRADKKLATDADGNIMADVYYGIEHAEVVIVELSDLKPSVLFECGMSYARHKKIILMAKEDQKAMIPEILAGRRIEFYPATYGGERKLKETLRDRLREEFSANVSGIDATASAQINNSLCFAMSSPEEDGRDTLKAIIKKSIEEKGMKCFDVSDDNDPAWHSSDTEMGKPAFIEKKLREAACVIADLSWDDPTAFYLAGLAYGLRKKCKFLYHLEKEPPFDIKDLYLLRYSNKHEAEREKARNALSTWLRVNVPSMTSQKEKPLTSILFLAAEPTDRVRLRLGEELREIREELSKSRQRDSFKLELPELSLRPRDITRAFLETNASIIHFSGHGGAGGQLFFETEDGSTLLVEPDILADLFKQFSKRIKCVILNACYSEKQAEAISHYIDYVVGMNQAISDNAAIAFSIGFYQAIGAGKNIEEAFELGKIQSGLQSALEYQTPVLLKRQQ
jgi:hypothetical protein